MDSNGEIVTDGIMALTAYAINRQMGECMYLSHCRVNCMTVKSVSGVFKTVTRTI